MSQTAPPFITLDNVTLRLDHRRVFEHTSWAIAANEHWAILGANGSGKSLLAKALVRRVPLVHGQIHYCFHEDGQPSARPYLKRGEILSVSPDAHRELLRQHAGYHQARWQSFEARDAPTVAELLTGKSIEHVSPYEVSPLTVSETVYRTRRDHAVELLGISYLLDRKIVHVSNGEARKVLLARALVQSPRLLILDDPFGGLDYASRATLRQTLDDLLEVGAPQIFLVTARLDEILPKITHVACVADYQIVAQGPKEAVLRTGIGRDLFAPSAPVVKPELLQFHDATEPPSGCQPLVLIEMRRTSVTYGAAPVLADITWAMRAGEHWAVLGPNGAGKTTLLSLILADNPQAYANEIRLFGRQRGSGESIWEIKQHLGWVSPELQMYYQQGSTCFQVICSGFFDSIGLYRACSPEQHGTAKRWMAALNLEALANRPFGAISAGEQRLVLLARALVKQPKVLILDEPCQGLDAARRTQILTILDQLCRRTPVNLIYVTHHFDEMPEAISHVLHLENGRIQQSGPRRQVLAGFDD